MSQGVFDPSVPLNVVINVVAAKTIPEVAKAIPEVAKAIPEVVKTIPEVAKAIPEISLPENDITKIGDVFDGFSMETIDEHKEYFIVGIVILCVIGYYTYNNIIQMNDSLNDKDDIDETKQKRKINKSVKKISTKKPGILKKPERKLNQMRNKKST